MIIAYQYRLKPNKEQIVAIESWLEKLRHQYNYLLADRFDWWQNNRCYINSCPLSCGIALPRDNPDYYSQKRSLVGLKANRPWYKDVQSQVLQNMVKRVKLSFDRYIKGDTLGRRSGKPRFKGVGRYRTFTYPQIKQDCITGNRINLPKLGVIKFIKHRQLPTAIRQPSAGKPWRVFDPPTISDCGAAPAAASRWRSVVIRWSESPFRRRVGGLQSALQPSLQRTPDCAKIKTASITRKADGYYLTLSLEVEVESVPTLIERVGAIDLGLIDFLVDSDGESITTPKYYRASEEKLGQLQKQLARQKKGSNRRSKTKSKIAKLHLKIKRQRHQFFYETWYKLFSKYDAVGHEKLNIKGLSRSNMAKSILDAAWGTFLEIGACIAEKTGKLTIPVNPRGSSTECSSCGHHTKKTLADRWHLCGHCGCMLARDWNSAIVLKYRAAGHPVLNS